VKNTDLYKDGIHSHDTLHLSYKLHQTTYMSLVTRTVKCPNREIPIGNHYADKNLQTKERSGSKPMQQTSTPGA